MRILLIALFVLGLGVGTAMAAPKKLDCNVEKLPVLMKESLKGKDTGRITTWPEGILVVRAIERQNAILAIKTCLYANSRRPDWD